VRYLTRFRGAPQTRLVPQSGMKSGGKVIGGVFAAAPSSPIALDKISGHVCCREQRGNGTSVVSDF
jgi:hypothetical protein